MNKVTTVLTVTDRIEYLKTQIKAIENQTIDSDIIIHWNTDEEYTLNYPAIIYRNQHKSAPLYNRFFSSVNITTPYIFICDDDILPGKRYLERCIEFSEKQPSDVCIVNYGMIFSEETNQYDVAKRIHHNMFLSNPKLVHMGGQGYFFKTNLLRSFCEYETYDSKWGEDIHLGYVCWENGIRTYVLDSDENDKSTWQDLTLGSRGVDDLAQWRYPTHRPVRNKLMKKYTKLGWAFNSTSSHYMI